MAVTPIAEAQGYSAVPYNLDVSRGAKPLNAEFVLTSEEFAVPGAAVVDKIVGITLTKDVSGTAGTLHAITAAEAKAGEVKLTADYAVADKEKFWKIDLRYNVTNNFVSQVDGEDHTADDGVRSQLPLPADVKANEIITVIIEKTTSFGGRIFPQSSDDDFSIADVYDAYLPFGMYVGTDYETEASSGPQDSSGVAGGIGGAFRGAAQAGDRFEVPKTVTKPDKTKGWLPAYEDKWFTGEQITLVYPEATPAVADKPFNWSGSAWVAGAASGNDFPEVRNVVVKDGAESILQDKDNAKIATAAWRFTSTLSRVRDTSLGAKRWPKDAFINVRAGDGTTVLKAFWTGSGWATGASPGYQPMRDPMENDLSGLPGDGDGGYSEAPSPFSLAPPAVGAKAPAPPAAHGSAPAPTTGGGTGSPPPSTST